MPPNGSASDLRAPLLPHGLPSGALPLSLAASRLTIDPEAQDLEQRLLDQAQAEKQAHRREQYGLLLNALSTLFGTGMSLFAKVSGSQGIGVFEIVLTRSLILVLFTGPELLYFRVNPFKDRNRRWLLVLRGVLGFLSVSSLYLAVSLLPLADASVLSFLSPIFVAALSPFILGEKTGGSTLLGIPVAMVGVVLVAQPSFWFGGEHGISPVGVIVGVMQALFNSLSRMTVRALSMGSKERMSSIIFGQGLISCIGAGIMCTATKKFQVPDTPPVWGALLTGGLLGYFYQLALTGGLQRARAAPAVAMAYLSVIWGILADMFVFHDVPDNLSLLGAAIICLSSFFVAFSQKRSASQKAAAAAAAADAARQAAASSSASLAGAASTHSGGSMTSASTARLGGVASVRSSRRALDVSASNELHKPLLGAEDGEEVEEARAGDGQYVERSSSGADWASAREGGLSTATSLRTVPSWRTAGSGSGEDGASDGASAFPGLKAERKQQAVAAAMVEAAMEVQPPGTPAAPAQLHPGSTDSLALLGASPNSQSAGLLAAPGDSTANLEESGGSPAANGARGGSIGPGPL